MQAICCDTLLTDILLASAAILAYHHYSAGKLRKYKDRQNELLRLQTATISNVLVGESARPEFCYSIAIIDCSTQSRT